MNFEPVIGLEVHCQLATQSKLFCGCKARMAEGESVADEGNNSNTCEVCTGQPGSLPALNKKALEYAIRAGLALECTIQNKSVFARKNYFYPDLPKGYQISQFEEPLCLEGGLEIGTRQGTPRRVGIQRIHMEEDAGKSVHMEGYSLVNLNRAGTPLIEIVTHPEIRSPEEAGAYLRELYSVVTYIGICDGNLQEGNFRCDANVSVRPVGESKLGTRVEIKNINSFKFVEKSLEYEIARQIEVIKAGGKVIQETRLFDSARGVTQSMRTKEEAEDYRYFPDPDLLPVRVTEAKILEISKFLPELPQKLRARLIEGLRLSEQDAAALTMNKEFSDFFLAALESLGGFDSADARALSKTVCNLLTVELARLLNEGGGRLAQSRLTPQHLGQIARLQKQDTVSSSGAKTLIAEIWKTGDEVEPTVARLGLLQVSDLSSLEPVVEAVLQKHPEQVAEFKAGKEKVLGFLVGQVMKASGGKSNPARVQDLIRKKLGF